MIAPDRGAHIFPESPKEGGGVRGLLQPRLIGIRVRTRGRRYIRDDVPFHELEFPEKRYLWYQSWDFFVEQTSPKPA